MSTADLQAANQRRIDLEHNIDQDLDAHIADDLLVNAIRGGKLVPIRWHNLTEAEKRAAYYATNQPNY